MPYFCHLYLNSVNLIFSLINLILILILFNLISIFSLINFYFIDFHFISNDFQMNPSKQCIFLCYIWNFLLFRWFNFFCCYFSMGFFSSCEFALRNCWINKEMLFEELTIDWVWFVFQNWLEKWMPRWILNLLRARCESLCDPSLRFERRKDFAPCFQIIILCDAIAETRSGLRF